jgi:hypothetical protein
MISYDYICLHHCTSVDIYGYKYSDQRVADSAPQQHSKEACSMFFSSQGFLLRSCITNVRPACVRIHAFHVREDLAGSSRADQQGEGWLQQSRLERPHQKWSFIVYSWENHWLLKTCSVAITDHIISIILSKDIESSISWDILRIRQAIKYLIISPTIQQALASSKQVGCHPPSKVLVLQVWRPRVPFLGQARLDYSLGRCRFAKNMWLKSLKLGSNNMTERKKVSPNIRIESTEMVARCFEDALPRSVMYAVYMWTCACATQKKTSNKQYIAIPYSLFCTSSFLQMWLKKAT